MTATTIFLTKKQKKLMRERRKKKKMAVNTEESKPSPSSVIVIPANLTAKEAKKFRKEERRKARAAGRDENQLQFVVKGETEKKKKESAPVSSLPQQKRPKKSFPRINDLVEQAKKEQASNAKKSALQADEDQLTEAYKQKYVALDCEMVGIGSDGKKSALARVSMVDWDGNVLMDTFVKVPDHVTDFRTHVSGVKPKHLKETAMNDKECREKVYALLKGKVLVGHALKNDLHALMLQHPKENIRDTAKYRPFQRYGGNKWRPRKLRDLVKEHLDMTIQEEGQSHDSVEDARATMSLFKLVRKDWEEDLAKTAGTKRKRS